MITTTDTTSSSTPTSAPASPSPRRQLARQPSTSRWTGEALALLGTMPDATLAARLGVHPSAVFFARYRRGIPAYAPRPTLMLSPEQIAQLGTRSDAQLAAQWHVAVSTVRKKRIALGIPIHSPHAAQAAGAR